MRWTIDSQNTLTNRRNFHEPSCTIWAFVSAENTKRTRVFRRDITYTFNGVRYYRVFVRIFKSHEPLEGLKIEISITRRLRKFDIIKYQFPPESRRSFSLALCRFGALFLGCDSYVYMRPSTESPGLFASRSHIMRTYFIYWMFCIM